MNTTTIDFNETKVEFVFYPETERDLPNYQIRINGRSTPYEMIVETNYGQHTNITELILFDGNKRIEYWNVDKLTLDIAVETYNIILSDLESNQTNNLV